MTNLYSYVDGKVDKYDMKDLNITDLNPEKFSYIVQGLVDKKLQTNKILEITVPNCNSPYGLALVSICLRLGANPNTYIPVQGSGDIHILGVVAKKKNDYDPKIFILLITILMFYGSNASMPIYSQSQALIHDKPLSSQSVIDWYISNGYGNEIGQLMTDKTTLEPSLRKDMVILTDDIKTAPNVSLALEDMELAILCQSKNITSYFIFSNASNVNLDVLYDWTIKYYATSIPIELIKARCYPHYYQINHIIMKMQECNRKGYQTLLLQLVSILKTLIISGVDMDVYQLTMIKLISDSIAKLISDAYEVPYWKKACSNPTGPIPSRLTQLAKILQYSGGENKEEVCKFIKNLNESDQSKILTSATSRQRDRISIMNSSPSDFISGRPSGVCHNTIMSGDEIYQYADFDIASYKDKSGNIYCFTRDLFPNLIETKKNPYTSEDLPPSFIDVITRQYNLVKQLGMEGPPETLGTGLKRLHTPDKITNDIDNMIINRFNSEARRNQVPESALQPSVLVPPITTLLLQNLGVHVELDGLVPEHQYITFVRTFMDQYKKDPSRGTKFFEFMRIAYSSSP